MSYRQCRIGNSLMNEDFNTFLLLFSLKNVSFYFQVRQSLESLSSLLVNDYQSTNSDKTTPSPLKDTQGQ